MRRGARPAVRVHQWLGERVGGVGEGGVGSNEIPVGRAVRRSDSRTVPTSSLARDGRRGLAPVLEGGSVGRRLVGGRVEVRVGWFDGIARQEGHSRLHGKPLGSDE